MNIGVSENFYYFFLSGTDIQTCTFYGAVKYGDDLPHEFQEAFCQHTS
jgi:hypothetical protein